jgi:hypothetical protein
MSPTSASPCDDLLPFAATANNNYGFTPPVRVSSCKFGALTLVEDFLNMCVPTPLWGFWTLGRTVFTDCAGIWPNQSTLQVAYATIILFLFFFNLFFDKAQDCYSFGDDRWSGGRRFGGWRAGRPRLRPKRGAERMDTACLWGGGSLFWVSAEC